MQVPTVNSGNTTQQTSSSSSTNSSSTGTNTLGKDDFLKLLITQVRYQDPLNPTDDKEFIAQLAQFSSLEQMQNLNQSFTDMASLQQNLFTSSVINQAVGLMGKEVEGTENNNTFSGKVEGMKIVDGVPKVIVDGLEVNMSSITKITLPTA